MRMFGQNVNQLMGLAGSRQQALKDPALRDDMAAARAVLKRNSVMLLMASKAYIRHPELAASKANRDYVLKEVGQAVGIISNIMGGKTKASGSSASGPSHSSAVDLKGISGGFSAALDDLDRRIIMDPLTYNQTRSRPSLEERLESIISGAALMADSSCTRDDRRDRIVAECNAVRQALQNLLSEYMSNAGKKERSPELDKAIDHMGRKTQDLRRQLRKAVADHVSDFFLDPDAPLVALMEAAQAGDQELVKQYSRIFTEHCNKLVEVAHLACSVSSRPEDEEGVTMVRYAASQMETLCPQVIHAAEILAARPKSKVAQQNMDNFRQAWDNQVRLLTDAVDDITTIDDFMAISESHILEEIRNCVAALQNGDGQAVKRTAEAIRGRTGRFTDVVAAEMDSYEKGFYTERVLEAVAVLNDQVMPNFGRQVQLVVGALSDERGGSEKDIDENELIDASCLVYDGVREVRRCVLLNRADDELDPDEVEMEAATETTYPASVEVEVADQFPDLSAEDKQKMAEQIQSFQTEKHKFDQEVAKWDDSGNDIVTVAKNMCLIMMDMTDFTRGRGRLQSTMDVINAAKKISEAGTKLDKAARLIAEQCPESSSKSDLLVYLQQIALYTHQLNITSKVKADVETLSSRQLIATNLDGATSLIQAAKNLMNAVVSTVKASYVASTKYGRRENSTTPLMSSVVWKMKPPEKKPLVRMERPQDLRAVVRRSSTKRQAAPMKVLSQFQGMGEQF